MLEMERQEMSKRIIPIWEKVPGDPFVLYVGKKKLIKRKEFESFIATHRAI